MKLSDTQLIILTAASQREGGRVLPLPKHLTGGAAAKVVASLLAKSLIAETETEAGADDILWQTDQAERHATLAITAAGLSALDRQEAPARPAFDPGAAKVGEGMSDAHASASAPRESPARDGEAKTGKVTKQAQLVALLRQPEGATVAEIATSLGWQPHTVRGALAGALKKKLGLVITSEKDERRGRIYRIVESEPLLV